MFHRWTISRSLCLIRKYWKDTEIHLGRWRSLCSIWFRDTSTKRSVFTKLGDRKKWFVGKSREDSGTARSEVENRTWNPGYLRRKYARKEHKRERRIEANPREYVFKASPLSNEIRPKFRNSETPRYILVSFSSCSSLSLFLSLSLSLSPLSLLARREWSWSPLPLVRTHLIYGPVYASHGGARVYRLPKARERVQWSVINAVGNGVPRRPR